MPTPILDHMVINTRFEMDLAARRFEELGFQLTPRGYHSLGSINHLMIFDTDYLELLGLPPGREPGRPELARAPVGIDGLVFKTEDADRSYEQLRAVGLAGDPPRAFTRPLEVDGVATEARFRTVTARAGAFPGRVYFCEHGTPELVWRPAWREHPNGARATAEFIVMAQEPEREAGRYAGLLALEPDAADAGRASVDLGGALLTVLSPAAARERFGDLTPELRDGGSRFACISIVADGPLAAERVSAAGGFRCRNEPGRTLVEISELDSLLEFRPAAP